MNIRLQSSHKVQPLRQRYYPRRDMCHVWTRGGRRNPRSPPFAWFFWQLIGVGMVDSVATHHGDATPPTPLPLLLCRELNTFVLLCWWLL